MQTMNTADAIDKIFVPAVHILSKWIFFSTEQWQKSTKILRISDKKKDPQIRSHPISLKHQLKLLIEMD